MGIAQEILSRDSIHTIVTPASQELTHTANVDAFVASLDAKKYLLIKVENVPDMPSHSDGTVKVTHVYYREVLPR